MPILAAELLDLIISFLHSAPIERGHGANNYLTKFSARHIAKCALISRNWVPSSRRILFYRVHVKKNTAYGFAKLFRRPERLTFLTFIRELEFRDGIADSRWMTTVFPRFAKYLPPSIQTVILAGRPTYASDAVVFRSLSGVTHFELVGTWTLKISDTLKCVTSFPVLEGLKIWLSQDWDNSTLPAPIVRPPKTLRSLNFRVLSPELLFEWMHGSDAVISDLHVYIPFMTSQASAESVARYIRSLGSSLVTLALTFNPQSQNATFNTVFAVDFLKSNTQLRAFYFQAGPNQTLSILRSAQFSPSVESITFVVQEKTPYWNPPRPLPSWSELDWICEPLRSVRRLEIAHLVFSEADAIRYRAGLPEICAPMLVLFPLCVARGIVTQTVEVDKGWVSLQI
ncbi:hypothetical protein B0H19DRAFT_1139114 [Mycena capillaripes]|nr:hypothetical protein B0H19DRAFT_1139114 [Mycena capillaripes]